MDPDLVGPPWLQHTDPGRNPASAPYLDMHTKHNKHLGNRSWEDTLLLCLVLFVLCDLKLEGRNVRKCQIFLNLKYILAFVSTAASILGKAKSILSAQKHTTVVLIYTSFQPAVLNKCISRCGKMKFNNTKPPKSNLCVQVLITNILNDSFWWNMC